MDKQSLRVDEPAAILKLSYLKSSSIAQLSRRAAWGLGLQREPHSNAS